MAKWAILIPPVALFWPVWLVLALSVFIEAAKPITGTKWHQLAITGTNWH